MFVVKSPPLPRAAADALSETLMEASAPEAGAVSLVETDDRRDLWRVEAHYCEPPQLAALAELGVDTAGLSVEPLPDIDWVARSLEGLAAVAAGRFIVHGSHDRQLPPGGIAVQISAGTAFGTGHHGTTRGCLIAADRLLKHWRPRRILDLGCGTGVLAIAAAKAARVPAVAIDIDAEAVRVTLENATFNGAAKLVRAASALSAIGPAAGARQRFDLIFANILAGPLVALARHIVPRLKASGALVLSGLTIDQERQVAAAYRNRGLRLAWRVRLDNWSTLVFTRPGKRSTCRAIASGPRTVPGTPRPAWR